jgi:hypothetical protein
LQNTRVENVFAKKSTKRSGKSTKSLDQILKGCGVSSFSGGRPMGQLDKLRIVIDLIGNGRIRKYAPPPTSVGMQGGNGVEVLSTLVPVNHFLPLQSAPIKPWLQPIPSGQFTDAAENTFEVAKLSFTQLSPLDQPGPNAIPVPARMEPQVPSASAPADEEMAEMDVFLDYMEMTLGVDFSNVNVSTLDEDLPNVIDGGGQLMLDAPEHIDFVALLMEATS